MAHLVFCVKVLKCGFSKHDMTRTYLLEPHACLKYFHLRIVQCAKINIRYSKIFYLRITYVMYYLCAMYIYNHIDGCRNMKSKFKKLPSMVGLGLNDLFCSSHHTKQTMYMYVEPTISSTLWDLYFSKSTKMFPLCDMLK